MKEIKKTTQLYEGKAKKVYSTNDPNYVIVSYKDDATALDGLKKGTITGKGVINNKMSNYLCSILEEKGIPTHFVEELNDRETLVKKVSIVPLEVIIRNISAGSFAKRYGVAEGIVFDEPTIEFSYKNDQLHDPLLNAYHARALGLATETEIETIKRYAFQINEILREFFLERKVKLVDFKMEYGRLADGTIVLADESWHQGVVGIVASRMAEEYSCPTFLICLDGDKGKASSRSYGGFNLFRSLEQLSGLLESYGGHELAAGFTIRRESIAPFREKMMALCASFRESDACSTALAIDCEIPPELLTIENIQALGDLEPCGAGCPRPVLCMRGLHVTELAEVGGGKHLRLRLSKGTHTWGAIFFSTNAQRAAVAQGDVVDIAFTPQINEYRSVRSVQLNLVDIRPDKAFREAQGHDRAVYKKHLAGGELSCDEAECLLPTRQDFVAVWRYLAAFSQGGVLSEELGCLSRKISRCAKLSLSAGKTRICLDVLAEQGLLQLEQRPKSLCIRLCADGRKVDLEKSPILIHLKKQKAGT